MANEPFDAFDYATYEQAILKHMKEAAWKAQYTNVFGIHAKDFETHKASVEGQKAAVNWEGIINKPAKAFLEKQLEYIQAYSMPAKKVWTDLYDLPVHNAWAYHPKPKNLYPDDPNGK